MLGRLGAGARRGAEIVAVGLLTALFAFFIVQIASRYVFNRPFGWTAEACLIAWLWLVFWGAGLIIPNREHVRFDSFTVRATPAGRRVMAIISCAFIVVTFVWSLPASIDYVQFMGIERSGTLRIPLSWIFSVFIIFAVGVIVRQVWYLWKFSRGADPDTIDPPGSELEIREV